MRFEVFDYAQLATGAFAPGHAVTIYESDGVTKATLYVSETGGTTSNPIVSDSTGLVHCWVTSTKLYKSVDSGPLTPLKIVPPIGGGIWKSVTDRGAVFDGVHDDIGAINDTIDEVYKASGGAGGTVLLPPGTAAISSAMIVKSGVTVLGAGMQATTLKLTGNGPVVKVQDDFVSTPRPFSLSGMTLRGNTADTSLGDGVFCSTPYGIGHVTFRDLWITNCGRDGMHFSQPNNPWWAQYLTFDNIVVGTTYSPNNSGCGRYGFFAEGGFSTNRFHLCRFQENKMGVYVGKGSTSILPEAVHFDTVNVQNVDPGDAVAHGIHLNGVVGAVLTNCYIEGISPSDSTAASSALYVDDYGSRNIVVHGGIFAAFHKGIHLYRGEGAEIEGVNFLWNGRVPTDTPTDIVIGTDFGVYSAWIGRNHAWPGGTAHTYLSDPGGRAVGWLTGGDSIVEQTFKTFRSIYGPTVQSGGGSPEGVVAAPVGSLYTRVDGGTGTTLYVKESGTGNTGWVAK